MALRQRTWVILLRPYYNSASDTKLHYAGVPKAGLKTDLGIATDYDTMVALKGVGEGMEEGGIEVDKGGWVMWYATTSYPLLREKYKQCLEEHAMEHTRIVEVVPVDTMVTPIA